MKQKREDGFTLAELLVAMAIASVVIVIFVSAYTAQVRAKNKQERITDMTQTSRAVLMIMTNEIRMAGLDPTGEADAEIFLADAGEMVFSLDNGDDAGTADSDGDCCDGNEQVRYHLTNDADDDGVNDNIADDVECHIGRETGSGLIAALGCGGATGGLQPVAMNVDVLNFVYLDEDGAVIPTPVAADQLDDIRAVEITIVARSGTRSTGFFRTAVDTASYFNAQGQQVLPIQNDRFQRLSLTTTAGCRNIGT